MLFFKLKEELDVQRLHSRSLDAIAQIISGSALVRHDHKNCKSKIDYWSNEDKKVDLLCYDIDDNPGAGDMYLGFMKMRGKNSEF